MLWSVMSTDEGMGGTRCDMHCAEAGTGRQGRVVSNHGDQGHKCSGVSFHFMSSHLLMFHSMSCHCPPPWTSVQVRLGRGTEESSVDIDVSLEDVRGATKVSRLQVRKG